MFYRNAPNEQAIINTQEVTTPQKSIVSPPHPATSKSLPQALSVVSLTSWSGEKLGNRNSIARNNFREKKRTELVLMATQRKVSYILKFLH